MKNRKRVKIINKTKDYVVLAISPDKKISWEDFEKWYTLDEENNRYAIRKEQQPKSIKINNKNSDYCSIGEILKNKMERK